MSITSPLASAKVSVCMMDNDVMLSVTHKSESVIEFMQWITEAVKYYQAKLKFDVEYANAESFVIDYRIENVMMSVVILRDDVREFRGHTL